MQVTIRGVKIGVGRADGGRWLSIWWKRGGRPDLRLSTVQPHVQTKASFDKG